MEISFKSLGTDINIQIVSDAVDNDLEKDIRNFYREKEKIFSRFDKNSELSNLNSNLNKFTSASSDIIEIAKKSLAYYRETNGYFDPRIIDVLENAGYDRNFKDINPEKIKSVAAKPLRNSLAQDLKVDGEEVFFSRRMDFSGIAKGYITDKTLELLKNKGYRNFLVDSGGDIRICGHDEDGKNWTVSLEGVSEEKLVMKCDDEFPAIATSGITRRKWEKEGKKFHHLINPKNYDEFSFDLKSVTVMAKTCEEADVWAKVLFLMGRETGTKMSEEREIKSVFLDYRSNVFLSTNIKNNLI